MLKNIPTSAANFLYPLSSNEFLSFSENSTFKFMIRLCLNRFGVPLVSNPSLRSFLHTVCQRFCQSSEPCPNPYNLSYCPKLVARGAGGGLGGGVGEDLSLNMYFFTDRPAQTILLNPFHYTATKSPFTLLEITMGQDKIYGWSAQQQIERKIIIII